jgi:hypothetical protein
MLERVKTKFCANYTTNVNPAYTIVVFIKVLSSMYDRLFTLGTDGLFRVEKLTMTKTISAC